MREMGRLPFVLRLLPAAFLMLAAMLPFSIAPRAEGDAGGRRLPRRYQQREREQSLGRQHSGGIYGRLERRVRTWRYHHQAANQGRRRHGRRGHRPRSAQLSFNVDKHGYVSGKSKAIFHFDVKAYSVAFPDQVSAHAYLVGNRQRRVFTIQGRACGDGKIRIESTKVPDLLLFDGAAQKSIGAWNIFPPQDETIAEVDKHLNITSTAYVKRIKMHMKWKASKCITFALGEHRDAAGNKDAAETAANGPFATLPITDTSIITYTNTNVAFDPEANTHRMKESLTGPLATLATLVTKEWPDAKPPIKVYVYRAWGAPGSHGANSFHYSGQALDLNLSDFDHGKYGCLAGLAYEAGFGWSYYENANHVHVSSR